MKTIKVTNENLPRIYGLIKRMIKPNQQALIERELTTLVNYRKRCKRLNVNDSDPRFSYVVCTSYKLNVEFNNWAGLKYIQMDANTFDCFYPMDISILAGTRIAFHRNQIIVFRYLGSSRVKIKTTIKFTNREV